MNEYELLQLLEECGYEPSDENLNVLKEDASLVETLLNETKVQNMRKRAGYTVDEHGEYVYDADGNKRTDGGRHGPFIGTNKVTGQKTEQGMGRRLKVKEGGRELSAKIAAAKRDGDEETLKSLENEKDELRRQKKAGKSTEKTLDYTSFGGRLISCKLRKKHNIELNQKDGEDRANKKKGTSPMEKSEQTSGELKPALVVAESPILYVPEYINLEEGLTEYQLMQILDENNCTTTDEDVDLLVEAIETGKVLLETRVTDKIAGLDKEPDQDNSEIAKDNKTGVTRERSRKTYTDTHPKGGDNTPSSEISTHEDNDTGEMKAEVHIHPKYNGSKGLGGHGEADNKSTKININFPGGEGQPELKVKDEYTKVPEERKDEARKALKRKAAKRAMKAYSDSADEEVRRTRYNKLVEKHGKEKADKLVAFEEKKNAKPKLERKQ